MITVIQMMISKNQREEIPLEHVTLKKQKTFGVSSQGRSIGHMATPSLLDNNH
jgi:hypothetical protein